MEQFRYSLEKGSRKGICPNCEKKKFVRYIDTTTGEYTPDQYGRCDREVNCGYHLKPSKVGDWKPPRQQAKAKRRPAFIPVEVLEQTLKGYEQNTFLQNLTSNISFPFDPGDVERVTGLYYLGTVSKGYRAGAITFPFIDSNSNVRAIQVKQFDKGNHTTGTDFIHSIIERHYRDKETALPDWLAAYQHNDLKVSCMFGAHLLSKYPLNPIALVEAPKTAIYGSLYFGLPDNPKNFLWLAVYNLSSINYAKCKELQGREVYLFPDLSKNGKAFELWSNKARELSGLMRGTTFTVSDLLEKNATEEQRSEGYDLADYLIELDWREFRADHEKYENNEAPETSFISCEQQASREELPGHEKYEKDEGLETSFISSPIELIGSEQEFSDSVKEEPVRCGDFLARNRNQPFTPPEKFNPEEFWQWFNVLPQLPDEIHLQAGISVYNPLAFVTGRLNHIKAFTGCREQGNRGLFIHQLNIFRTNVIDILNAVPA